MAWKSHQDFERDLLLFAEYSVPTPEDEREMREMPDCIREYYNQMERNQRAANRCEDLDEGATYVIHSGRGRGMGRRLMQPGQDVERDPNDDIELRKKIREVAGLGFSNKLIEQQFKNLHLREEQETYKDSPVVPGPNLKWDEPQSSSSTGTTIKSTGSTSGSSSPSRSTHAGDGDTKKSHHHQQHHKKTATSSTITTTGAKDNTVDTDDSSTNTPTKSTSNSGGEKSNHNNSNNNSLSGSGGKGGKLSGRTSSNSGGERSNHNSSSGSGGKGKTSRKTPKKSFSSAASSSTAGFGDAYFTATSNSSATNSFSDGSEEEGHYDKDFPKIDLEIGGSGGSAAEQRSQGYPHHQQQQQQQQQQRSPQKRPPRGPYNNKC